MAKNTNKRIPVKWIRDKAKGAYEKGDYCFVCNTETDLELHHLGSITLLLEKWCKDKNIILKTDEDVLEIRDEFIANHNQELYKDVYTLCNPHHVLLHSVFGKAPALHSVEKQRNWLEIQKSKKTGIVTLRTELMTFSSLYSGFDGFSALYKRTP